MKLLTIILMALFLCGCGKKDPDRKGKVERTYVKGYNGAAKRNPYLAAQRFLVASPDVQNDVNVRRGYINLSDKEAVVVAPASSLQDEKEVDKIMRWIANGGQYVCVIERGERHWEDVGHAGDHYPDDWRFVISDESEAALEELLRRNQLSIIDDPSTISSETLPSSITEEDVELGKHIPHAEDVTIELFGEDYKARIGGNKVIVDGGYRSSTTYSDKGENHRFISKSYGMGRIYFITDGRLFRNPYLKMNDHAALLEAIATGSEYELYGDIVFSFGGERSFWTRMMKYAWPVLLAIIVLIALWLWKGMPRFGPLLEVQVGTARDYAQTVTNTGNFLWTHKRLDALLTPLRNEVYRRSGMFDAEGQVEASLVESLSESSGVPEDQVLEALSRVGETDPTSMVRITKNLQTILKSL